MRIALIIFCIIMLCACASAPPGANQIKMHQVYVGTEGGHGTGTVINDSCVVTAWHVVDDQHIITVKGSDEAEYPVTVRAADQDKDIAVLCASAPLNLPAAIFAKQMPEPYTPVSTVGFPLMWNWVYTHGEYQGNGMITAPVANGNSGGGVFDAEGYYIGFADFIALYHGLTFAHLVGIVEMPDIKHLLDTEHIPYAVHS